MRQGENLSPILFAIFLNDLEDHLQQNHCTGTNLESTDLDVTIYLKLLGLLYANATVIFGTNAKDLKKKKTKKKP